MGTTPSSEHQPRMHSVEELVMCGHKLHVGACIHRCACGIHATFPVVSPDRGSRTGVAGTSPTAPVVAADEWTWTLCWMRYQFLKARGLKLNDWPPPTRPSSYRKHSLEVLLDRFVDEHDTDDWLECVEDIAELWACLRPTLELAFRERDG